MKSKITKRFAGFLAFLMLATQITIPVYAMVDENGSDNQPVPTLYDDPEPELTNESIMEGEDTPSDDSTIEEDISAMEEGVAVELSESVDEDNITEVIETDVEDVSDEAGSDLVDQAVDELLTTMEGQNEEQVAASIEKIENKINDRISVLTQEFNQIQTVSGGGYGKNGALHMQLQKKIRHLHDLRNKLRAKAIRNNGKLLDQIVKFKNVPALYEIRWGNLTAQRQQCLGATTEEIKSALATSDVPEKCEENRQQYKGKITVDSGTLTVKKNILFEANDKVVTKSGQSIEFSSAIAGHWDGLLVEYVPSDKDVKKTVSITVSIGDLKKTYSGNEILGRKKIGNTHMIEFRSLGKIMSGLTTNNQNKLIQNKLKIEEKISNLRAKLDRIRLMKNAGSGADDLEAIIDEAGEYNFDETTAAEADSAIEAVVNELNDDSKPAEITAKAKRLKLMLAATKAKAKNLKFKNKLIPFKDTDDNEWFTQYVSAVKDRGIISGYKDAAGNELGEFRPANSITVAEILKIGLETSNKGTAIGFPTLQAAANHWAKGYVKKAEELGLNLVNGSVDLNRPATRGEVIRMMLEALGIKPDKATQIDFSDVPRSHKHAQFIQYAKELGIISGDAGATTFRPDAPINRAEAAKIADQINKIIIGGWDSVSQ